MAARPKIVFMNDEVLPEQIMDILRAHVPVGFDFDWVLSPNEDEKAAKLKDAECALVWRSACPASLIAAAPRLRMIQRLGQGLDRVDVEAARARGIVVANAGGANAVSVAEHTLLLILLVLKRVQVSIALMRAGRWPRWEVPTYSFELSGKTVGVVGMGHIGQEVARRVKSFGAEVLWYDIVRWPHEKEAELGVRYAPFPDLLRQSDVVTLHVPLLPATRRLIDAGALEVMKRSAVLINTSRGPVVDEQALIAALQTGRVAGAGLDVFEKEPLSPNSPLLRMENVVCTPHIAGVTAETTTRSVEMCMANIARVFREVQQET